MDSNIPKGESNKKSTKEEQLSLYFNEEPKPRATFKGGMTIDYRFIRDQIINNNHNINSVTVYYKLDGEGEQSWRLLATNFRDRFPVGERIHINVRAFTFQYQEENMELADLLNELQLMQSEFRLNRQKERQQQFINNRDQALPKITFLYGSPLYEDQPENGVYSHLVKYLKPLNSMVGTLRDSRLGFRLKIEEFNENNLKESLDSRILYCVVHAEGSQGRENAPDFIFGQNKYGGLEKVRLPASLSPISEEEKVDLLILQTTNRELPQRLLSRYARNIIFINSNLLNEDEISEGFITEFFRLLLKKCSIREAFSRSLESLIRNEKYTERFSCCCFHKHDPKVCTFQIELKKKLQRHIQPDEIFLNPYKNHHYKFHRIVSCKCPKRFQMVHEPSCPDLDKKELNQCCCHASNEPDLVNGDIHSIESRFQLKQTPDTLLKFNFLPGIMKETELLRAYSIANEKGFSRAGKHQKIILSQIMAYRKQCDGQNKSRFIINIFGEEGSGKEYLKSMLINYLVIKRQLDGKEKWKEVMRPVDKVEVQQLTKHNYQLIVLDATQCQMDLKELVSYLVVGSTKLVILSEKPVELEDVEKFECKPLSSDDAYDFFVRQLKKKKLAVEEKSLLRKRLKLLDSRKLVSDKKLYPRRLRRAVEKLEDFKGKFEEFLEDELTLPASELQKQLQELQAKQPEYFTALMVISQWERISQSSIDFLLKEMMLDTSKVNFTQLCNRRYLLENNEPGTYYVVPKYRVELSLLPKKEFERVKELIQVLLRQAKRLVNAHDNEINTQEQRLVDGTINNPSSMISAYLRLTQAERKEFPLSFSIKAKEKKPLQLSVDELNMFLKRNLHVAEVCDDILCRELVYLTVLTFSFNLSARDRKIDRSFTNVILRNVNKRSNPLELDLEETVLAMAALELQLQSIVEGLIIAHHGAEMPIGIGHHSVDTQNEDKKAEECLVLLNKLKAGLDTKLVNTGATNTYGHLLTVAKFNIFLIELTRVTQLEPMMESKEEMGVLTLQALPSRIQPGMSTNFQQDRRLEEQIKTLMKLRNQYEDSLSRLKQRHGQPIKQNHTQLKQVVRLLVYENYNLRIHTVTQLNQGDSYLRSLHSYLQKKIRCENFLNCISSKPHHEYLVMLDELIQIQKELLKLANHRLPDCLRAVVVNYDRKLKRRIAEVMQNIPIFTMLTAYPQNTEQCEKNLGVSVEFKLASNLKGRVTQLAFEEKQLTISNLQTALKRGSRYICIWFEYSCYAPDELLIECEDDPQVKPLERTSNQRHSIKTADLAMKLPTRSDYVAKSDSTIFVCGSHGLAKLLAKTNLASTIVSFSFGPSQTPHEFYIKKVFQMKIIEYFVASLQKRLKFQRQDELATKQILELIPKESLPEAFLHLLNKVEVLSSQEDEDLVRSATELRRRDTSQSYASEPSTSSTLRTDFVSEMPYSKGSIIKVYLYSKEDAFLSKLKENSRMGLVCEDQNLLNEFIEYIKNVCLRKHLFPGGINIVDWKEHYDPKQEGDESEPVYFLDKKLDRKLPLLARKKSLIFMKNSNALFSEDVQKKSTFHYLVEFLKERQNISILFCRTEVREFDKVGIEKKAELIKPEMFAVLKSDEKELLTAEYFKQK